MSQASAFQRRAARVLASDEPTALDLLDRLITDGCAEALNVETELRRLRRRRDAALHDVTDPDAARAVVEMGEREEQLQEGLTAIQDAVGALMRRRSRRRLSDFIGER